MAARKGREFFEAFHRPQGYSPPPELRPELKLVKPGQPPVSPGLAAFSFTQTQLLAIGAAVGAVILIAFFLGFAIGRGSAGTSRAPSPIPARATPPPAPPAPAGAKVVYRLQLISGIRDQNARDLVQHLKALGYESFSSRSGNSYTIYVGEFDAIDSPAAKEFQQRFGDMEYQGKKQFSSCLYVKTRKE